MIIADHPEEGDNFEIRLTLIPHRSMSWRDNQKVIALLTATCLAIALFFTLALDTWMILPFAGLEVIAFAIGLYYASWKISYRDIITITSDQILVDQGVYRPRKSWSMERRTTRLKISSPKHEWESRIIELESQQQSIRLGKLLGKDDIAETIALLSSYMPHYD